MQKIMQERIYFGCGDDGIGREIPGQIKERTWVAPFAGAVKKKMEEGIMPGLRHIGILLEIEFPIEQTGGGEPSIGGPQKTVSAQAVNAEPYTICQARRKSAAISGYVGFEARDDSILRVECFMSFCEIFYTALRFQQLVEQARAAKFEPGVVPLKRAQLLPGDFQVLLVTGVCVAGGGKLRAQSL